MITSFLIAVGLNFDTFSISIVAGANTKRPSFNKAIKVASYFGCGHSILALIGFFIGTKFSFFIKHIDHWIAFVLLTIIGLKIIFESKSEREKTFIKMTNVLSIIPLVIATSIDALVVGITFAFMKNTILQNILIIAVVTFAVSFIGFYAGKKLRSVFNQHITIIGGLILIGVGIKILIEHLFL